MPDVRPHRPTVAIVPCSGAKLDRPVPARDLYVGTMFASTTSAVDAHGFDTVLILSAKHGLVDPDTIVAPYSVRMGEVGSVSVETLVTQMVERGWADGDIGPDIYAFLPAAYRDRLGAAAALVGVYPADAYEGTAGIGEQRGVNRCVRQYA